LGGNLAVQTLPTSDPIKGSTAETLSTNPGVAKTVARLNKETMATRQARIDDFTHVGAPPVDQPQELLCEDHVGTYVLPFLCRWRNDAWQNVDTDVRIDAAVVGWRQPGSS
jgi:hypothetical protein